MIRANMAGTSLATPTYVAGTTYGGSTATLTDTASKGRYIVTTYNGSGDGSESTVTVTIDGNPVTVNKIGHTNALTSWYFDAEGAGALSVVCTAPSPQISIADLIKIS